MVDFHSHILPEMDDGSESVEMSLAMLRESRRQGVDLICSTSHFYADEEEPASFLARRGEAYARLREAMENPADYPDDQVLIGIEITDRDLITKYGVEAKWKSRQTTFIFGQCVNSTDDAKTVKMMTALINKAFENQT